MHHAGANVLSPTVRDLSITHRNLPLSRAHPISCPQSRSQRPVYAPPHRERSLDQIVIYLTTEALAALPLRAQPPRPRPRCPQSRSQCILSYRKRSLDQVAICCISPEAVTIRSSTTLKLTPSPQPRCPQNRSQCALSYTPRETLYQIAIYHQKPLAALLLRPTLNPCAPHKDQQQYRDSGDATADHRGPPRVHQTISTAEDHLDAEIGSLTESTETSRQTTQHAAAQLLLEAHSGQIQWISAYESRAPESGQMSMPMGGTIEHRSTPNSEQSTQPSTAPRCEL